MTNTARIVPVILSGGGGTRLWPMSTPDRPKQFLALAREGSLLADTLARATDAAFFDAPIIVANVTHRSLVAEAATAAGVQGATIILEPAARNTAPAIALAALAAPPGAPILVMPSDHVIADGAAFRAAIEAALPAVRDGWLATFGIAPDGAETGYGYIRVGEAIADGVHRVARFIEKPGRSQAEEMIAEGAYCWNGGIFLFRADIYLGALAIHAPDMLAAAQRAMDLAERQGTTVLPDADAFAASPADSIDYAVMEKAERVAVIPVAMGWSDVGSWDALYDIRAKDAEANAVSGPAILDSARGNLIQSDGVRVSISGLDNLIVVASGSEVMILPRGHSQNVRTLVELAKNINK
jgi:mannose-1-phosphate guanylyltransferase/mannose-1-phosphate guanylyltransferase/mannose-6-phosphate isomerase